MKNYYTTMDNIVLTFSDVEDKNGFDFAEGVSFFIEIYRKKLYVYIEYRKK